jgi:PST family polysaccharide transporter
MVLARGLDRTLGLVSTLILARLLAPDDFGLIAMAMSFVALLDLLRAFGLDIVLIQHASPERAHYDTAWTMNVMVSAAVSITLIAFAQPASIFFKEPELVWVMVLLGLGPFLESFRNIGVVDFRRNLDFEREFRFLFYARITRFLVTVPLAFALRNHWALVIGMLIGRAADVAFSYGMSPYRPRPSLTVWRELFGFSKWLLMNNLVQLLTQRSADFVIGRLAGARSLGLFNVSQEIALLPSSELAAPINRALLPGYARQAGDRSMLQRGLLDVVSMISLITLPTGVGLIATAHLIVPILLGSQWLDAIPLVPVIAIFGLVNALGSNTGALFIAIGQPRFVFIVAIIQLIVLIPGLLYGVDRAGAIGAGWAYVVSSLVAVPLSYAVLLQELQLRLRDLMARLWRPLAATALMLVAVRIAANALDPTDQTALLLGQLLVLAGLGVVVYVSSVLVFWRISGRPSGAEHFILRELASRLETWRGR